MHKVVLIDRPTVNRLIGDDPQYVKTLVLDALKVHHEKRLVQPYKQYLQRSPKAHTADRIIVLSAYLAEPNQFAGIKWIGSHPENYKVGMERANAVVILNDTRTNAPFAIMDGSLISSMRTLAITLITMDRLNPAPKVVAILGMGKLGKLHARFLPRLYPSIERIACFSLVDYDDVISTPTLKKCGSYREALKGADTVIAVTTAPEPYITPADVIGDRLMVNLSLMDFHLDVFLKADWLIVDDFEQCSKAKKVFNRGIEQDLINPSSVYELSDVVHGKAKDVHFKGNVLVNPLGMAIEDMLVAKAVYDRVKDDPTLPKYEIG
jgi:N-[(2S)-2-amino-2-carboxyethyl]-L-glutamate dehydrogenase